MYCEDKKVRLFDFNTGKCLVKYSEAVKVYDKQMNSGELKIDSIEYGKRAAIEREIGDSGLVGGSFDSGSGFQRVGMTFDSTSRYLLYPCLMGIKVIDVVKGRCVKVIGQDDASQQRFSSVVLCDLNAQVDKQMQLLRSEGAGGNKGSEGMAGKKNDNAFNPLLVALSYKKKRFFMFSSVDPSAGERDVLNEPPDADDVAFNNSVQDQANANSKLASEAILRTTMGDIHFKFFGAECPRTVENFVTHAKNGYYDNVIFHRVIKGFMLQTGDPDGNGTGGESIWGGEFEDEFHRALKHDRPFTVSMANAGE